MKPYRILKTFNGSQTGTDSQEFVAGTEAAISDHLAAAIAGAGWIEPVEESSVPQSAQSAKLMETKVESPVEAKVESHVETKPSKKKR